MAALAVKVFSLTVKTFSKPLAHSFQSYMLSHPMVRDKAIQGAQFFHRVNINLTRATQDAGEDASRAFIGKLNEDKALQLASKVFSETFLYMVGGGLIYYEYSRKAREEDAKKSAKLERRREKEAKHAHEVATANAMMQRIEQRVDALERQSRAIEAKNTTRQSWWGR